MKNYFTNLAAVSAIASTVATPVMAQDDDLSFSITADILRSDSTVDMRTYHVEHFLRFELCSEYDLYGEFQKHSADFQGYCNVLKEIEAEHDIAGAVCQNAYDIRDAEIQLEAAQKGLDYSEERALESANWQDKNDCESQNHAQTYAKISAKFLQTWPRGITMTFSPN